MDNDEITNLLMIVLSGMLFLLVILVIVYITIKIKTKKENKQREKNESNGDNIDEISTTQITTNTMGSVLDFMEFEKIEDNMIIKKEKKTFVMVIGCKGINYDLMSGVEKTSVEQGFVEFLNTLKYPIQLYIQTRKINLEKSIENYRSKLQDVESTYNRRKNQYNQIVNSQRATDEQVKKAFYELTKISNLYEYGKDIIRDTERMSLNKNILTKKYYVVIKYNQEDDLANPEIKYEKEEIRNMAFSELYTRAQSIIRTLSVCGISGKILDSIELSELLYMAYNSEGAETYGIERALKANYDKIYSVAPDVFDKKQKELDKEIEKQAIIKAQDVIEQVKSEKQKEYEEKERKMDELIDTMAKIMLNENEEYIGKEVKDKAIEKIDGGKGGNSNVQKSTEKRSINQ